MNSLGGFIFLVSILFGGYDDVTLNDVSVQNEEAVEDSYYQETRLFNQEVVKFLNNTRPIIDNETLSDEDKNELNNTVNEFILYLNDFKSTPITQEDLEYHEILDKLIYDLEQYSKFTLQYLDNNDDSSKQRIDGHFEKIRIHLMTLASLRL